MLAPSPTSPNGVVDYAVRPPKHGPPLRYLLLPAALVSAIALLATAYYIATSDRGIDERINYIASTLQTLRSEIELYRIQHAGTPPAQTGMWTHLLYASDAMGNTNGKVNATFPFGPYLDEAPLNRFNNQSAIGAAPSPTVGWVYTVSGSTYTISAVNTTGNGVLTY